MLCISKVRANKRFVKRKENARDKDREGLFQIKQAPTSFIGSADDIIFSTEHGVKTIPRSLVMELLGLSGCWVGYETGVHVTK